jgi:dipeptidyl-peptidase-3
MVCIKLIDCLNSLTLAKALAYCSTVIFLGINLPNVSIASFVTDSKLMQRQFEDIRDNHGFKNLQLANRNHPPKISPENHLKEAPLVDPAHADWYLNYEHFAWETHIAIHELIGHGTGNRLLRQDGEDSANFDLNDPPISPLTGSPIESWYKPGETVSNIFGSLSATLSECRADCVALFLIVEKPVLSVFGYDDHSDLKADTCKSSGHTSTLILAYAHRCQ